MPDGVDIGVGKEKYRGATNYSYGSKLTNRPVPFRVASEVASPSFGVAVATPGHPSDTPLVVKSGCSREET